MWSTRRRSLPSIWNQQPLPFPVQGEICRNGEKRKCLSPPPPRGGRAGDHAGLDSSTPGTSTYRPSCAPQAHCCSAQRPSLRCSVSLGPALARTQTRPLPRLWPCHAPRRRGVRFVAASGPVKRHSPVCPCAGALGSYSESRPWLPVCRGGAPLVGAPASQHQPGGNGDRLSGLRARDHREGEVGFRGGTTWLRNAQVLRGMPTSAVWPRPRLVAPHPLVPDCHGMNMHRPVFADASPR